MSFGPLPAESATLDTVPERWSSDGIQVVYAVKTGAQRVLFHADVSDVTKPVRARERQRFTGLRIVRAASSGDSGQVLFLARIFERGIDRSFGELSSFVREEGAWRYASGEAVPVEELEKSLGNAQPWPE